MGAAQVAAEDEAIVDVDEEVSNPVVKGAVEEAQTITRNHTEAMHKVSRIATIHTQTLPVKRSIHYHRGPSTDPRIACQHSQANPRTSLRRQHRHISSTDSLSNMARNHQQEALSISIRQERTLHLHLLPHHPARTSIQHSLTRNTHSRHHLPTRNIHNKHPQLKAILRGRLSSHNSIISNSHNNMRHNKPNNINILSQHLSLQLLQVSNNLHSNHFRRT